MFSLHLTNYKYDPNIVLIVQKSIITIGYLIYICVDIFFPFFIISSCHSFIIRLIIIIIFSFILHLVSKTWLIWSAYNALRELDYIFIDFSLFKVVNINFFSSLIFIGYQHLLGHIDLSIIHIACTMSLRGIL